MCKLRAIIILSSISLLLKRASAFATPSKTVIGISATSFSLITQPSGLETMPDSSMMLSGLETSIDFENNPGQAFGTLIFLAYVGFSVAAGLKYIFVDGWRPKL